MKVLVTGAAGQLGRALMACVPEGWDCRGLARADLDLADRDAIAWLVAEKQPDLVVNTGAYTGVDKAESEEGLAMAVNAGAPAAFADALSQFGGRLLQVSTDYVFDGQSSRPYLPDDQTDPLSVYGRSKLEGERRAGKDAIILRTSWVYSSTGSNFVLTMLRLMREGKALRVVNDQIGAPSWAPEIARVIWDLAKLNQPGIFHHRDGGETSWYAFAHAIAEEAHALDMIDQVPEITPVSSAEYPTPAPRPAYSLLDGKATRALLNDDVPHWRENLRLMLSALNRQD